MTPFGLYELLWAAEDNEDDVDVNASKSQESPMTQCNDVNTVAPTVFSIQQQTRVDRPRHQQAQHGGTTVNGGRRNVYRTNSRRRCDLSPAVKRCVVTDKSAGVTTTPTAAGVNADDTDTAGQQQQPALFSRRYVINLDPLITPRPTAEARPGRAGNMLPATGTTGKARWQRQQTTYQLTPRALRTRADVSAGARITARRAQTMTDENFLSATGKKLLDGSATARNGETCRVIELNLNSANSQTQAPYGSSGGAETTRKQYSHRTAATAVSLHYSDSVDHHGGANAAGGIVLPQLATHR